MVEDRAGIKAELQTTTDPGRRRKLEHVSEAIKWILVSCFGYQGYRNAKFGRIEAHEAINAYAREILLDAKRTVEECGWEVVHGIVDSIWLRPVVPEPTPVEAVVAEVSEAAGIDLEHEHTFEWLCLVPRRGESAGALNRYFGKVAGTDGDSPADYKLRGIECRQHSTPTFVADALPIPADLLVTKRATKPAGAYDRDTHVAGALRRAKRLGVAYQAGQAVRYLVVDDGARRPEHGVRLHFEELASYDADYYERLLVRAAESVVSPLGWTAVDVRRHLREDGDASLAAYR